MPRDILVVEDDELMRKLEAEILEEAGYTVVRAEGGRAAIEILNRSRPDLVLLDIVMPQVNGWRVLDHIDTLSSPPPVVIVTGLYETVPPRTPAAHVVGYLFKPFRADALVTMCADVTAAPTVTPPSGDRREARRTYVVEATLVSPGGGPAARGRLVQISRAGFRFALAAPVRPGDTVAISFRVPGHDRPLELKGHVRWRGPVMMGVEMTGLTPDHDELLRQFVESDVNGGASGAQGFARAAV
jgi:CheY-like chemotaxis protein